MGVIGVRMRALIARIQDAECKAFELCTSNVRNYNAIQQNINGKFASVSIYTRHAHVHTEQY